MSAPRHVRLNRLASEIEEGLGAEATAAIRAIAHEFATKPEPEVCPLAIIVASQCESAARLISANETAPEVLAMANWYLAVAGVLREPPTTSTKPAPAVCFGTTWAAEPRSVGMTIDAADLVVTVHFTARQLDDLATVDHVRLQTKAELSKRQQLRLMALAFLHFAEDAARELARLDSEN